MKLNLKKCSFGVEEGPFLGHLITKQGIKANPSKVKAVTDLDQPRTLKDIQSLNGKLAVLSRFLSKGAERSLAFFKVLKGCKDKKNIQWTTEADKALGKIKKLVQALQRVTTPRVGENLTMHLATSKESISVVLAAKRNEGWTPFILEVAKAIQDYEKCKEQSVIRKARTSGAIAARSTWPFSHLGIHILGLLPMALGGLQFLAIAVEYSTKFKVPQIISSKEEKHFKEGMFVDLCKGLKVTQSFSHVIEHMEIMHHIERQGMSAESNQGKRKQGSGFDRKGILLKQVTKIPQHKEQSPHVHRGRFRNANEWQGSYIINEVHKEELYTIVDTTDHSLVQTTKGTSLCKFYM
ncbi:hypothetical protein Tco_1338049 [Tanacetum coccineum]